MSQLRSWFVGGIAGAILLSSFGCVVKKEEPLLRIETPKTKIEINKSTEDGSTTGTVETNKRL